MQLGEQDALYLGALLHDIGKFRQRSEVEHERTFHPLLSALFTGPLLGDERVDAVVRYHHRADLRQSGLTGSDRFLAEIVCEADSLASGERRGDEAIEIQHPLRCIFDAVTLTGHSDGSKSYQPLSSLTPNGYRFPDDNVAESLRGDYADQWRSFADEARTAPMDPETLLELLRKYLWCVPSSSYKTVPDISLYEHSRLTAALAICLYQFLETDLPREDIFDSITDRKEVRYQLVCGDITGIQRFIYNIAHKGALRALKGRSFYLQQLLESIAGRLLEELSPL